MSTSSSASGGTVFIDKQTVGDELQHGPRLLHGKAVTAGERAVDFDLPFDAGKRQRVLLIHIGGHFKTIDLNGRAIDERPRFLGRGDHRIEILR